MTWVICALLAAFIWASINILDKYIFVHWIKNPLIPTIIAGIIGLIFSLTIYFVHGFTFLSNFHIALCIVAGGFYTLMFIFYFQSVKVEEVSRVIPLFHLSDIFVLILATIFLGEIFTLPKYIGFFLILIGAIIISQKHLNFIRFSSFFWYMIFSAIAFAMHLTIIKYVLGYTNDFWTVLAYAKIGSLIMSIPILYIAFPDFIDHIKKIGWKLPAAIFCSEFLDLIGVTLNTIAISIGYLTLVKALTSFQSLFVLILAGIIGIFYKNALHEKMKKSVFLLKIFAIIIMICGATLITT